MGNPSEAIGIVIPSHFTDEAIELHAVDHRQVDRLLHLDLLFFSNVAVPVVGLLGSSYFTSLILEEPSIASQFLSGSDSFIRPIVFGYNTESSQETFSEIANRAWSKGAKVHVPKEAFLRNAEFMDKNKPLRYVAGNSLFRSKYHEDLRRAVSSIQQEGLRGWQSQEVIIPGGSLNRLQGWLREIDPEQANCTGAFRAVEKDLPHEAQLREAKVVAAATWMYSLRGSMVGTLSVPPAYLPSISLLRRLSTTTQLDVARDVESRELPISVPFSQIAKMPLRFVLGLRELDAFSDIRKLLSKYRTSAETVDIEHLKVKIDQCRDQLLTWERQGRYLLEKGEQDAWDRMLRQTRKKAEIDRLKIWYDRGGKITIALGITGLYVPHHLALAAFAGGGVCLLSRYITRQEAAMSTSLAQPAEEDTMYSVAWGTDREKSGN